MTSSYLSRIVSLLSLGGMFILSTCICWFPLFPPGGVHDYLFFGLFVFILSYWGIGWFRILFYFMMCAWLILFVWDYVYLFIKWSLLGGGLFWFCLYGGVFMSLVPQSLTTTWSFDPWSYFVSFLDEFGGLAHFLYVDLW